MIREWPTLFQSRTQCLEHLFIVIGNGYEWRRGALVRKFNERSSRAPMPAAAVEILARHRPPLTHCYPLCGYSEIVNLPPDIRPDWHKAAQEIALKRAALRLNPRTPEQAKDLKQTKGIERILGTLRKGIPMKRRKRKP